MIIGTVRAPDETRINNTFEGFHKFHKEETQEEYSSFEIFHHEKGYMQEGVDLEEWDTPSKPGWYYWVCLPGYLPVGDATGPFADSRQALQDADEWNPQFDED